MRKIAFFFAWFTFLLWEGRGQIPVEVLGGSDKTTVDIMFFKYFRHADGKNSRWLFFNRNRATLDYRMTGTAYLPQFSFTEAFSYNHEKWKGFAPVVVAQVFNSGAYPKAGIQYARIKKDMLIFSWLVAETHANPAVDYFVLFRLTPALSERMKLFLQAEIVNTFPTLDGANYAFTQRARVGLKFDAVQFGVGADFNEAGNRTYTTTSNAGVFLRYEF